MKNICKRLLIAQKMKLSIKDFFRECDQIRNFLRIWSHLLKKSLMENFIFCAVSFTQTRNVFNVSKSSLLWASTLPQVFDHYTSRNMANGCQFHYKVCFQKVKLMNISFKLFFTINKRKPAYRKTLIHILRYGFSYLLLLLHTTIRWLIRMGRNLYN